jgi:lipoate synthase
LERRLEEAVRLLETLVRNREEYFDKSGYLNSEGMKVVMKIIRIIAEELPEHTSMVREVRSRRSYESILKLLQNLSELHYDDNA